MTFSDLLQTWRRTGVNKHLPLAFLFAFLTAPAGTFAQVQKNCAWTDKSLFEYGNLVGNAGCVVFHKEKLLVVKVKYKNDLLDIPAGTSENNEKALCTAARETFEETGLEVVVHELIRNFDNKFYVFHCKLKNQELDIDKPIRPGDDFKFEISQAKWIDVLKTDEKEWRFPKQVLFLKSLTETSIFSRN